MTIQGTVPLYIFQIGWELPGRGVMHAATNKMPIIGGELQDHHELSKRPEQRTSFTRFYRAPIETKVWAEISGVEVVPTFEEIVNYFGVALKKIQVPSTVASTVKRWVYSTTAASDDLVTATVEAGDDATAFSMPFGVINRLEFGWELGGPATMTMDWLGQRLAIASTYTLGLSAVASEEINPAEARAYIDGTTIGSTPVTALQSFKFTVDNHYIQHWAADGLHYPNDVYRSEPRSLQIEGAMDFSDTTQYIAYASTTLRKIRVYMPGSAVASSSPSTSKSLTVDAYVYFDDSPWQTTDGRRQIRFTGETVYNTTATHDWQITVDNAIARQD